jgi:hypothetical protein
VLNPHLRDEDVLERGATAPRTPGEDALGGRPSRAERRREGLLPQSEDPLLRRPAGPPPGGGRRRSDAAPASADRDAARPPGPRAVPPISGPMTSAASPAATAPPRAAARPVPPRIAPSPALRRPEGDRSGSTAVPPRPSGVSGWPAEAAGAAMTPDTTQRVSGAAPAESAWGAPVAEPATMAAQPAAPRTPQLPPRAVGDQPSPAAPAPARPRSGRPAAERPGADGPRRERRDDDRSGADVTAVVDLPVDETSVITGGPARRAVDVPVGGRAAARLERQAAEAAARKSGAKRTAPPATPSGGRGPGREDDAEAPRAPRRAVQGVLAVVVIALVVLGVWSFTSPGTSEVAAQTPAASAPASDAVPAPPALPSPAPVVTAAAPAPAAPVKAPITVLNSTRITGLAATIGDQLTAGGWQVLDTGAYTGDDIAATTVYYTAGNAEQQQAATQLVEQFGPDLVSGPVERFFDVPGSADPGLVVVATGNWRP